MGHLEHGEDSRRNDQSNQNGNQGVSKAAFYYWATLFALSLVIWAYTLQQKIEVAILQHRIDFHSGDFVCVPTEEIDGVLILMCTPQKAPKQPTMLL